MIPSGLANRPRTEEVDVQYMDGFRTLDRSRTYGQGGPLPVSLNDVRAYLLMIEEDSVAERLKFLHFVQGMDGVYLEHSAKKAEMSK